LGENNPVESIDHAEFKQIAKTAKAVIRTAILPLMEM